MFRALSGRQRKAPLDAAHSLVHGLVPVFYGARALIAFPFEVAGGAPARLLMQKNVLPALRISGIHV